MAKSWKCELCGETVTELGSYMKLTSTRYAHGQCYTDAQYARGVADGRKEILDEQREAAERQAQREKAEREAREAREKAEAERRAEIAERERVNRIRAQQAMPLPPLVQPKAPEVKPAEPEKPKPDRFQLIDLE